MAKRKKLSPCAHCGSKKIKRQSREECIDWYQVIFYVECPKCGIRTGDCGSDEEAEEAWERRENELSKVLERHWKFTADKLCRKCHMLYQEEFDE